MQPNISSDIEQLLRELLAGIRGVLGDRLAGVYLYGSLITGGFDSGRSDIDLLAATDGDIDAHDLDGLLAMHERFVGCHQQWHDRIEVAYLSTDALRAFKQTRSQLAIVSPGEPLHFTDAGPDWLMNWYLVRSGGCPLFGPPPSAIISPVTNEEFLESLWEHVRTCDSWASKARAGKDQSYVIFTMCRPLVAHETSLHSSKLEAAAWCRERFPEWRALIDRALAWRMAPAFDIEADLAMQPETLRFVAFTRQRISVS